MLNSIAIIIYNEYIYIWVYKIIWNTFIYIYKYGCVGGFTPSVLVWFWIFRDNSGGMPSLVRGCGSRNTPELDTSCGTLNVAGLNYVFSLSCHSDKWNDDFTILLVLGLESVSFAILMSSKWDGDPHWRSSACTFSAWRACWGMILCGRCRTSGHGTGRMILQIIGQHHVIKCY